MVNFSQLYDKHVDSLFSFGSKFTSDRELIKDCIQDVFVKLFNKKETLDKVCNIESYLYVSLRNRINDEFRRQVRLSDEEITDYNTRRLAEQNNSYDFEKMEEEKRRNEAMELDHTWCSTHRLYDLPPRNTSRRALGRERGGTGLSSGTRNVPWRGRCRG